MFTCVLYDIDRKLRHSEHFHRSYPCSVHSHTDVLDASTMYRTRYKADLQFHLATYRQLLHNKSAQMRVNTHTRTRTHVSINGSKIQRHINYRFDDRTYMYSLISLSLHWEILSYARVINIYGMCSRTWESNYEQWNSYGNLDIVFGVYSWHVCARVCFK